MKLHKTCVILLAAVPAIYGQYSSPVRITNTNGQAVPAVDPTSPGRQAFTTNVLLTPAFFQNSPVFSASGTFGIPAGMRLVVEHISVSNFYLSQVGSCTMTVAGDLLHHGSVTPTAVEVPFNISADGILNRTQFNASAPVKLYIEGSNGGTVSWGGLSSPGTLPANITVHIIGYLVDCSAAGSCNN